MFHEDILLIYYRKYFKTSFWLVICIAKNFIWTTLKAIFSIFRFFCTLRFHIFKYCPIITNHTSTESLFIQLSDDLWISILKNWHIRLVLCFRDTNVIYSCECSAPVFSVTWSFRNHFNMLICCSRNIYNMLKMFNVFVEAVIHFLYYLINIKFQRTAFIWNRIFW